MQIGTEWQRQPYIVYCAVEFGLEVLDELFEILLLKQYGEHDKPIYIVNIEHKYDLLISLLAEQGCKELFKAISENELDEIGGNRGDKDGGKV